MFERYLYSGNRTVVGHKVRLIIINSQIVICKFDDRLNLLVNVNTVAEVFELNVSLTGKPVNSRRFLQH